TLRPILKAFRGFCMALARPSKSSCPMHLPSIRVYVDVIECNFFCRNDGHSRGIAMEIGETVHQRVDELPIRG
ncbi:unnamed protein product, partial [Musa acuminata subsp. burmannicoides]